MAQEPIHPGSVPAPAPVSHPEQTGPPDESLVERARQGDLGAFDLLMQRHQERIYQVIYHMISHHEDARDLTQETFITAYHALDRFRGDAAFGTWLYRIAVNKTLNFLEKKRPERSGPSLNDLDARAEHDPDLVALITERTPRREVSLAELRQKLNEAIMKLSEKHRLVVVMHEVQGMPHEEIARILDCSVGTVRSRLFYARQQLQAYLSDYL